MNWIREIVSGKKQRYKESGYNLDLTYVTPRIIAMSFPAAGLEVAYRNDIDDVSKLIKDRHKNNFLVFNLSGRKYNYLKFDGQVFDYPWEDHHSPPIHFLFEICRDIHNFLCNPKYNDSSVVAVHCLAGKGRTGTVICCYLLYSGAFQSADDALVYYKRKRFSTGGGVTQPSQVRYVKYFERLFFGESLRAQGFYFNNLICYGIPDIGNGLKPLINIFLVKKSKDSQDNILIFPNKNFHGDQKKFIELDVSTQRLIFQAPPDLFVGGDILIRLYSQSTFSDKLLFRFAFNTAFIKEDQKKVETLKYTIHDMDPDKVAKDKSYPKEFYLEVTFSPLKEDDKKSGDQIKEEQCFMDIIYEILKVIIQYFINSPTYASQIQNYKKPEIKQSRILLFGDLKEDDIDTVLKSDSKKDFLQSVFNDSVVSKEEFDKIEGNEEDEEEEEEEKRIKKAVEEQQQKENEKEQTPVVQSDNT